MLSHFLSPTMADHDPDETFVTLRALLRKAEKIVALDADLSWITFDTLMRMVKDPPPDAPTTSRRRKPVERKWERPRATVYINEYQKPGRSIEVFASPDHLMGDLKLSLAEGKRVFVTSNSKGAIERLAAALEQVLRAEARTIVITSDTVGYAEVSDFLKEPSEKALEYDVILTSPSISAGVDITFDDQEELIDVVYGFFFPLITTHFDCDQQLGRVRHPKAVKAWISPAVFQFDTARDVIRRDLLAAGLYKNLIVDYYDGDTPVYADDNDPFLDMAALVVSRQRASKNALKRNFIDLKRRQGFDVRMIDDDPLLRVQGELLSESGRRLADAKRVERLLAARTLRKPAFDEIVERRSEGTAISEDEKWDLERTKIERFYRREVSEALIKEDDNGRRRTRILAFNSIREIWDIGLNLDAVFEDPDAEYEKRRRRMRFLRGPDDVATTIYYLLHKTPFMANAEFVREAGGRPRRPLRFCRRALAVQANHRERARPPGALGPGEEAGQPAEPAASAGRPEAHATEGEQVRRKANGLVSPREVAVRRHARARRQLRSGRIVGGALRPPRLGQRGARGGRRRGAGRMDSSDLAPASHWAAFPETAFKSFK